MAWYDINYSCGHVGRLQIVGPMKSREWRIKREEEGVCPECHKKEIAEQNAKSVETAKALELPTLYGSEKQVAWAETIRVNMLKLLEEEVEKLRPYKDSFPNAQIGLEHIISSRTSARWWIDNRSEFSHYMQFLIQSAYDEIKEDEEAQKVEEANIVAGQDAMIEATIRPTQAKTETAAEIKVMNMRVEIHFPEKREDFREIVKGMHFHWEDHCWVMDIGVTTGTAANRAAEAGNKLLNAGFIIRIYDDTIRQKAIDADYIPRSYRWITRISSGEYKDWFSLFWPYGDDFYQVARRITGSRYDKPNVIVPAEQFAEIRDFAQQYAFTMSPGALQLADEAEKAKEAMLTVEPLRKAAENKPAAMKKPQAIKVPKEVEIDESLRDDD